MKNCCYEPLLTFRTQQFRNEANFREKINALVLKFDKR